MKIQQKSMKIKRKTLKIKKKINAKSIEKSTCNEFSYKIEDFFGFKNNQIKESREEFISL